MPDPQRICDLLLLWEEAKTEGRPVSVEELCAGQPELVEPLRFRVAKLEAVNLLLGGVSVVSGAASRPTILAPDAFAPGHEPANDWHPPGYELLGELGRGGMGV